MMDQIDPQQQLDQQQESERKLYIRIPNEILEDERLTATDKLVYGRAYSFRHYYESAEATGKALAICPNQVKISKRKLEKLGFFVMYENTGRGKKYIVPEPHIRLSKFDSLTGRVSKFDSQSIKIESSEGQNLIPEIKERLKGEEISLKDKSFKEAQAPGDESEEVQLNEEIPKRYGNAEVNEILDEWEEATGFSWHSTKQERFATNTLLRKYGSEATKALVRRVQRAKRADDQFAPQIAKPSQLVGKYEKLTALTMWEERQAKAEAKEAEAHAPAYVPEYMRMPDGPREEYVDVRPSTPEEKAEAHRKAMEIRAKLPFYVPKEQRKAGC